MSFASIFQNTTKPRPTIPTTKTRYSWIRSEVLVFIKKFK